MITAKDIPLEIIRGRDDADSSVSLPPEGLDLEDHLTSLRRELMTQALERCEGVQTKAADLLQMSFRSFRYYAKKLDLGAGEATASAATAQSSARG